MLFIYSTFCAAFREVYLIKLECLNLIVVLYVFRS